MKVRVTFDLGESEIAALSVYYGVKRANRETCKSWIRTTVRSGLETIVWEHDEAKKEAEKKAREKK